MVIHEQLNMSMRKTKVILYYSSIYLSARPNLTRPESIQLNHRNKTIAP